MRSTTRVAYTTLCPTLLHTHTANVALAVEDLTQRHHQSLITSKHSALTDSLTEFQLVFDSNANTTLIGDLELLTDTHYYDPVTLNGLSRTLTVNTSGNLLGKCGAYYHIDAVANIESLS